MLINRTPQKTCLFFKKKLCVLFNSYESFLLFIVVSLCCSLTCGSEISFSFFPKNFEYMVGSKSFHIFCSANFLPDNHSISWVVNGVVISSALQMKENSTDYHLRKSDSRYVLSKSLVLKEDHGTVYQCRVYNSTSILQNPKYPFIIESPPAQLTVLYAPLKSDPQCQLDFNVQGEERIIEASCCAELTTSPLKLTWVQRPVEWSTHVTSTIDSIGTQKHECLTHQIEEDSLDGSEYKCRLQSPNVSSLTQECSIGNVEAEINYLTVLDNQLELRCDNGATNIIGYTWKLEPDVEGYTLSKDRSEISFEVHFTESVRELDVTCTVFTPNSFGRASLKIKENPTTDTPNPLYQNHILIVIGSSCGVVILVLIIIILAYLIKMRGICFCFQPRDRYSAMQLNQMKQARESLKPNSYNRENGISPLSDNVNNHMQEEEEDIPPVPGGNRQISSHLLNYVDLDHGNAAEGQSEESPALERAEQIRVEYADILKPPTQPLREMS